MAKPSIYLEFGLQGQILKTEASLKAKKRCSLAWSQLNDGSVVDDNGNIVSFSRARFVQKICNGEACVLCGASRNSKPFNDEHVIPDWLLRGHSLHGQTIHLPNDVQFKYDRYKIPCCIDCNSRMGEELETPISKIFSEGTRGIAREIENGNSLRLFAWLALIFLKTHLRDTTFNFHLDRRVSDQKISDIYDWDALYFAHSIVKAFFSNCAVAVEVLGTLLCVPTESDEFSSSFDYADLTAGQTILIRSNTFAIVAVFNDSAAVSSLLFDRIQTIASPLSSIQMRELMVECAWLNLHLKHRPIFHSLFASNLERWSMYALRPQKIELDKLDYGLRGRMFAQSLRDQRGNFQLSGMTVEETLNLIEDGKVSTLFDQHGNFVRWRATIIT